MKKLRFIMTAALITALLSGCSTSEVTQEPAPSDDNSVVSDDISYAEEDETSDDEQASDTEQSSDDEQASDTEQSSDADESEESENGGEQSDVSSSAEEEWTETPVTGTKYITEDCYSRIKAIIGSDRAQAYSVGSKVTVTASTDSGYFKLEDGTFIHGDYLSDTKPEKPAQTDPPKTTVKPQTQTPASGSTDNTDGYTWAIKPQYDYDDVEILCKQTAPTEYVESEYNPPSDFVGNNYSYGYTFYYPIGETHLVKSRVLNEDEDNPYEEYLYTEGKKLGGMFVFNNSGKKGMVDEDGEIILNNKYDHIYSGYYLAAEIGDYSYTFTNNYEELDGYDCFYLPILTNNAYGLNTGKIYECDYIGATKGLSSLGVGVVVSGNIDTDSLYGDSGHSDVDISVPGGGKYGLAYNKELVVPCEYDGCLGDFVVHSAGVTIPLSGDNRIVFFKNDKIYVFDQTGKCYSEGIYDKVDNSNQELYYLNGYLPVCKNNKWGLIDTSGKEVISCQFEDITSVYGGKAWAKQDGKWGVIKLK